MQENKFEKQVQQKMEEFSLTPSAPVWHSIERQIKKKKDRRRVILWLLPLVLLTGGMLWWQLGQQNTAADITKTAGPQPSTSGSSTVTTPGNSSISTLNDGQLQPKSKAKEPIQTDTQVPTMAQKQNTFKKGTATNRKQPPIVTTNTSEVTLKKEHLKVAPTPAAPLEQEARAKEVTAWQQHLITNENEKVSDKLIYLQANVAITTVDSGAITETVATRPQPLKTLLASLETAVATKENKKERKWQWGISSRMGVSGMAGAMFASGASRLQDRVAASPTTNTGGSFWSPTAMPSEIKSGLSFSIGGSLKRKAGRRSFITTGLQYSYYSTRLSVGTRGTNDTLINFSAGGLRTDRYYRNNGRFNPYNNSYHYIEVPVGFEYQLFKNIPVHVQHGASVSRLIASNALYYNTNANLYVESDEVLRKAGVQLFTAIEYKLMKRSSFSLFAGPHLQYSISKLYQNNVPGNQHLRFIGLNTRLTF